MKENNKPDHSSIVAKDNSLISQMAKFELSELRLIAYCLAHYDSRKPENRSFTARVDELTDIFPMDEKCAYAVVKKAMLGINKKPLQFEKNNKEYFWNWFSGFIYDKAAGEFEFRITPEIQPYLLALKGNFTRYRLQDVYQFIAGSTWKLYELVKQWSGTKHWSVELDELRLLLGVAGKYHRWNSFNIMIDSSIKEINELSDLKITYEKKKRGRRVIGLTFHIDKIDKRQLDDVVITAESDQDKLQQELMSHGINHKTALDYAQKTSGKGLTMVIIGKLPEIVIRAKEKGTGAEKGKKKGTIAKYITGAIKNELQQGRADTAQKPAAPTHQEALSCWIEKKRTKEACPIRERGTHGQRKKCQICFEKLPTAEWGK